MSGKLFSINKSKDKTRRIIYFLGIRIRYKIRTKRRRNSRALMDFSKYKTIERNPFCTGCSACFNVCKVHAIKMLENEEGFLRPVVDAGSCTKCGKCNEICPILNVKRGVAVDPSSVVCYAAQASDEIRSVSSSGGLFTVFAEKMLSCGGYVCGASYSDEYRDVRHMVTNSMEDMNKLRISKYVQSEIGSSFRDVKNILSENKRVLFVGTPCQVAGLKAYLNGDYENLILVDLICCGVPSRKVYRRFLVETFPTAPITDVRFRMKDKGWHSCAVQISSGESIVRIPNDRCIYEQLHFKGLSTNKVCGFCPHDSYKREGDISIGDFWGVEQYDASLSDDKGTSIALINTRKGFKFWKSVKNRLKMAKKVPAKWIVNGNRNIIEPIRHHNRRQFFNQFDKMPLLDNYNRCMRDECDCIIFNNAITEINYGSMLTAFALQEFIMSLGLFPKVLNHARVKMDGYSGSFAEKFAKEYFNLTETCQVDEDFRRLNGKTTTFIVGSDQMWRICYWQDKVDKVLLDFVESGKRKIGCAISFGVNEFEGTQNEKEHFRESLKSYHAISVREDSGVDICAKEFGASAKWILDPVFIVRPETWEELSERSDFDCGGKLCYYGWCYDVKRMEDLQRMSDLNACKGVVNITFMGCSVEDWLRAIKTCKLFVSDSYHGICFAILFRKPFVCITELGQGRFDSLARLLNIKPITPKELDRLVEVPRVEYDRIYRILERERADSSDYLAKVIKCS